MEIKVVILGSSGSAPTKDRSLPSVALVYNGEVFLFDCGEGSQMQMLKYGINSFRIKAIFLSHAHGDHIIGIAGLVRSLALNGRTAPLDIFVPAGYEHVVKSLISFDKAIIGYTVRIHGVNTGLIYRSAGATVSAFPLKHTVPTYGYVFKENDKRRFDKEKSRKLGIKGIMFSELEKNGSIRIGKRLVDIEGITRLQKGKAVVYATDTRPMAITARRAKGAELLIHECSYADAEKQLALERMHSSTSEAARIAKRSGVKMLILTHISARYKSVETIEKEAKRIFSSTVIASDGYSIVI
jgi:ribonuclease Z